MSASLVGSEMCIRDRHRGGPGPRLKAVTQPGQRRGGSDKTEAGNRKDTCLLYTSDAADDM
eukprot:924863-Alexandrium_andersonii.AAC.1